MHRHPLLIIAVATTATFAIVGRRSQAGLRDRASSPLATLPAIARHLPSLAILPDTQYYASTFPDVLAAQTAWVVAQQKPRNIAAVFQVGDLVDDWANESQWKVVSTSLRTLDDQLPYVIVPGNHDTDQNRDGPINRYFAPSSMPWIAGTMVLGRIENNYAVLAIGERTWLVLGLEFGPRDAVLAWADQILKAHAELPAIIVTHAYLSDDGTRYGMSQPGLADRASHTQHFSPQAFSYTPGQGIGDGERIWQKVVAPNRNVQLVFCGHDNGVARLTSVRPDGSRVHQILSDYQWLYQGADDYEGGSGFLRIVAFDYANQAIHVETYSPYLDRYLTDDGNQFTLPIEVAPEPQVRLGARYRRTR